MILVASRSIFPWFLPDEEQFANLQMGKNLLRTCREKLGEIGGVRVQVWDCGVAESISKWCPNWPTDLRPRWGTEIFAFHFWWNLNTTTALAFNSGSQSGSPQIRPK